MPENRRHKSLVLTLTQECNLSCVYCYEKNKSTRQMPLFIAQQAISKHLTNGSKEEEVEISFHGGEPFLAFDLLQQICEWMWSQNWPLPFICFVTTNGTLVHGKIQDWVSKHKEHLYLGLSLDGTRDLHNLNRSNSFDLIDIDFFLSNWPDQQVKMTLSNYSLPRLAESMIYLHKKGFLINSNFAYGIDWSDKRNVAELSKQLDILINFYLDNPQYQPCAFLSMPIDSISSPTMFSSKWCGVGTDILAVDVDGREYPCQMFFPNVTGKDILDGASIDWTDMSLLQDANCKDCVISRQCPTCYGVNLIKNSNLASRDPYLCALTKVRALACSYFQARLLTRDSHQLISQIDTAAATLQRIRAIEVIQSSISLE